MRVVTQRLIKKPQLDVWELLLNSNVDQAIYCPIFCLGTPRPLKCEYNVGELVQSKQRRRCVSDQGEIQQDIDVFEPPTRLRFHMVETDLAIRTCVEKMYDEFRLQAGNQGTLVERVTALDIKGPWASFKRPFLWLGIKSIHKYVFDAWASHGNG